MDTYTWVVDGAVLPVIVSTQIIINVELDGRTAVESNQCPVLQRRLTCAPTLESHGVARVHGSNLGLARSVLEVELIAAELGVSHACDLETR